MVERWKEGKEGKEEREKDDDDGAGVGAGGGGGDGGKDDRPVIQDKETNLEKKFISTMNNKNTIHMELTLNFKRKDAKDAKDANNAKDAKEKGGSRLAKSLQQRQKIKVLKHSCTYIVHRQ